MRLLSILTAAQIAVTALVTVPLTVTAAPEVRQHNNIVLFAQFGDPSETNFMTDRTEKIEKLCNDGSTVHSINGYMNAISYGQLNVTSYFPQMKDGEIIPYRLSRSKDSYVNCEQYAFDMISNIEVPADIPLDGDHDGIVDNVVLVVDGKGEGMDDPLWPKSFTANGMKINGLDVCTVNIQNSNQLFENIISGGEGVLCHEFLHTLGYPDLYRNKREGTPVGMWDIMASNSVFVQYPLAYQRATISGWLDYSEITESGTYTLAPVLSDSGNRLYLLKTPLSETEFFAVEYRKQGAKYSDEIDGKIYGTGLCVYRVNTELDGNFKENRDQIYVFRPDDTDLESAAGDLMHSNYGGENALDHIGSLDWSDGITEGALVYSNGTNSGIRIGDIIIEDDKLTFTAEFAERGEIKLWESADTSGINVGFPYDIAYSEDGTPYIISSDYRQAQLYKYNGKGFEPFGSNLTASGVNDPVLAFCRGVPYVMYRDSQYNMILAKFDTESGIWTTVYKHTEMAQYADMTSDGKDLYFAFTTGSFPCYLNGGIFNIDENHFYSVGSPNKDSVCNISIALSGDRMVIGCRSITNEDHPQISTFPMYPAGKWETYRFSETACSGVSVASEGDSVLITPWGADGSAFVYKDETVTELPLPDGVTAKAFSQEPAVVDGRYYIAVNGQDPDELIVYGYDGEKWEQIGDVIAREIVNELSIGGSGDTLMCSYFTSNTTPVVKLLTVDKVPDQPDIPPTTEEEKKVRGDVNADGEFTVADVVMLGGWLVRSSEIVDYEAGDLCEDGITDVYDLVAMRKMLVK